MESADLTLVTVLMAVGVVGRFLWVRFGSEPFRGWTVEAWDWIVAFFTCLAASAIAEDGYRADWWVWLILIVGMSLMALSYLNYRKVRVASISRTPNRVP